MVVEGPGGGSGQRRFPGHYVGCCDLQAGYTNTHLNSAIGMLADVSWSKVQTVRLSSHIL